MQIKLVVVVVVVLSQEINETEISDGLVNVTF